MQRYFSYSLGDAIDWKPTVAECPDGFVLFSYSLGDAIDWKHTIRSEAKIPKVSYSLGDAIDWKNGNFEGFRYVFPIPYLLGDAIDWKLETVIIHKDLSIFPYSLGDAIDWKHNLSQNLSLCVFAPLLARGRDRLETSVQ